MATPTRDIAHAIAKIRKQLEVNLTYFSKDDSKTLEILQSHIEDHLKDIEHLASVRRQTKSA